MQSKGLSRVVSNSTVQKHRFFAAQLSFLPNNQPDLNGCPGSPSANCKAGKLAQVPQAQDGAGPGRGPLQGEPRWARTHALSASRVLAPRGSHPAGVGRREQWSSDSTQRGLEPRCSEHVPRHQHLPGASGNMGPGPSLPGPIE